MKYAPESALLTKRRVRKVNSDCKYAEKGYAHFEAFVDMIAGKWKLRILYFLAIHKVMRYGEIKQALNGVSHKVLSSQLKELERDGIIIRTEYAQIPPKVEYTISELGLTLSSVFDEIVKWNPNI